MARRFIIAVALGALIVLGRPVFADDAPDASTPKAAVASFFKAMENGDPAAAKTLASGSEKQLAILDVLVPVVHGFKQLEAAALKKWGEEGRKQLSQGPGSSTFDVAEKLKTAKEEITGDTATIIPADPKPNETKEPMKLKKVDGKWKLDMASLQADEMSDPNTTKMLKSMADIAKATAAEIDQGKYPDAKSAKEAMGQKILAALGAGGPPPEAPKK